MSLEIHWVIYLSTSFFKSFTYAVGNGWLASLLAKSALWLASLPTKQIPVDIQMQTPNTWGVTKDISSEKDEHLILGG